MKEGRWPAGLWPGEGEGWSYSSAPELSLWQGCRSPLERRNISHSQKWWTGLGDKAGWSLRPQSWQEASMNQREPSSGTTHWGQGFSREQRWTSELGADPEPCEDPESGGRGAQGLSPAALAVPCLLQSTHKPNPDSGAGVRPSVAITTGCWQ